MPKEHEEGYMQQHFCACVVDLSGEKLTTIEFDETSPKSWPEIRVLQEVHGNDAVYNIRPVGLGARESPLREKERLVLKYGRDPVEAVYAGKSFQMEFFVPGWPIDPTKAAKRKRPDDRPKPERMTPPPDAAEDARV